MNCVFAPGRHVGADVSEAEDGTFEAKTQPLVAEPSGQQDASTIVDAIIDANLTELGHGT